MRQNEITLADRYSLSAIRESFVHFFCHARTRSATSRPLDSTRLVAGKRLGIASDLHWRGRIVNAAAVTRILRRAITTGGVLTLAACKGEGTTDPGAVYPYDLVFERREGSTGAPDLYLFSLRTLAESRILASTIAGMHPSTSVGSQVVFVRADDEFEHEVFIVTRGANDQFSGMTNVTNNVAVDVMPALSPNGQRVAFVTDRAGFQDIFVVNVDGTNARRITLADPPGVVTTEWWPAWSRTGELIAYSSTLEGTADIWTTTVDATPVTRTLLTSGPDTDLHPTWSHDGSRIAFQRIDHNTGEADILILTISTGVIERIEMEGQQLWPAWSPDGDLIAFSSNHEGADFEIYTMDPDGGNVVRRTNNGVNDLRPAWLIRPVQPTP
jgi:Tol biopolymer transport system component